MINTFCSCDGGRRSTAAHTHTYAQTHMHTHIHTYTHAHACPLLRWHELIIEYIIIKKSAAGHRLHLNPAASRNEFSQHVHEHKIVRDKNLRTLHAVGLCVRSSSAYQFSPSPPPTPLLGDGGDNYPVCSEEAASSRWASRMVRRHSLGTGGT